MRNVMYVEKKTVAEGGASEPLPRAEGIEEEWEMKVQKDAVLSAAIQTGGFDFAAEEGLEIRLRLLSEEITHEIEEERKKLQKRSPKEMAH